MPLRNVWAPGGTASLGYRAPQTPNAPAFGANKRFYNPNQIKSSGRVSKARINLAGEPREFDTNFFERVEYNALPAIGWAIQQPARVAERPIAALDVVTGGAVRRGLESVGNAGGQDGDPGIIGSIVDGIGSAIYKIGNVIPAVMNGRDAMILDHLRDKPADYVIPEMPYGSHRIDGGLLGFFGLGGRQMNKREFLADLHKRGWFRDERTGAELPEDVVFSRAKEDPFGFGYARVNDSIAVDLGVRMVTDPLNLAFFVPGGAVARVSSAAGRVGGAVRQAGWARQVHTGITKTRGFGYGYLKDLSSRGLRATALPDTAASARAILRGAVQDGSLRGIAHAMDLAQRAGRTGLRKTLLPGLNMQSANTLKALGRTGLQARALQGHELLRAYQRGAMRMQLGSVTAEFASGAANDWVQDSILDDTFVDAATAGIHTFFNKVNNNHPLSENETFILASAVALPTVSALGEYVGFARRGANKMIGDNDAVVFAKSLVPDLDKNITNLTKRAQTDELYKRFGRGDVELGQRVFRFMLDYLDSFRAWKELAGANRRFLSQDELAANGAAIAPVLEAKVARMRQMGRVNAKGRLAEMWELIRHGHDRNSEFNVTPDAAIDFWIREFEARSQYSSKLREFGDFVLTESKIFTKEMADDIMRILESEDGIVTRDLMSEIVLRYPVLLSDPKKYGDFWARFALIGDEPIPGGRTGQALDTEAIAIDDVREAVRAVYDELPSNDEMFFEARDLELTAPATPRLQRTLKSINSYEKIRQLRNDTTGAMRAFRRDETELARLRNTEFSRNGLPKYETTAETVGYRGTRFSKEPSGEGPTAPDHFTYMDSAGNRRHVWLQEDGRIALEDWSPDARIRGVDPRDPLAQGQWVTPDRVSHRTSEALVKMVQMGGRVVELDNPGILGGVPQFLAAHGFREVARLDAADGKSVRKTWYAYQGGSVYTLPDRIGSFPRPRYVKTIVDPNDTYQNSFQVSDDIQRVSVERLRPYMEIDRETTPKVAGDTSYLDELTETIKESGHFEPIELTYNPYRQVAMVTDGNHRLAVARRLKIDEIPVEVKIDTTMNEGAIVHMESGGPLTIITAAELVNDIKNFFEPYRATQRKVKDPAAGLRLATQRADQASLSIPSGDALGRSPFNSAGQFHGSPAEFDAFSDIFRNPNDFIGAGTFMSDSLEIVSTYAPGITDGAGKAVGDALPTVGFMRRSNGNIYRVRPKQGTNIFNLHQPMPDDVRAKAIENLEAYLRPLLADYDDRTAALYKEIDGLDGLELGDLSTNVRKALDELIEDGILAEWAVGVADAATDPYKLIMDAATATSDEVTRDAIKAVADRFAKIVDDMAADSLPAGIMERVRDPNIEVFELYRFIYEELTNRRLKDVSLGEVNDAINFAFRDSGYDGLAHIGGLVAGDGTVRHNVNIVFDPQNVEILERAKITDIVPQTKARFKQITARLNEVRKRRAQLQKDLSAIDERAEQLRTIRVDKQILEHVDPDQQQALRELIHEVRTEYPMYDVEYRPGFNFDPADGVLPGLNLERNLARHVLYDYGPLSRIASLWHGLFDPISSKAQSKAARQSVFNLTLPMGAKVKDIETILTRLNGRLREQVTGTMRVPWFRDITSLPANQVNTIARDVLGDAVWARISERYGSDGFHRLLDEAANEFVRTFDAKIRRGEGNGALSKAMREGYRQWTYAPVVGSTSRLISKQFYHIFRFMLDLRWHFLNIVEADILSVFRSGISRVSEEPRAVSPQALMAHTTAEGLPAGVARAMSDGPAAAMELFDSGLYLHNRNLLPVLERNFDQARLASVDAVLDDLPTSHPVIRALTERFGLPDRKSWSEMLDDMMYDFDNKGVRTTVFDEFKAIAKEEGWTAKEVDDFTAVVERISEKNQQAYDDLIGLYQGNLNRNRVERILNSYWLYWPISYQIKATKWLFNVMFNRMGGRQTNLAGAYLVDRQVDAFFENLANDPEFARQFEEQEDLWFVAGMFFPATPVDIGVSLNRGVRYASSLAAPQIVPEYLGIDGPEDIFVRMLEMGPVYSTRLFQTVMNQWNRSQDQPEGPDLSGLPKAGSGSGLDRVLGR